MNIKPPRTADPIVRQLFDEATRQGVNHDVLSYALRVDPTNLSALKHGKSNMKLWQAHTIASCLGMKLKLESESCGQAS